MTMPPQTPDTTKEPQEGLLHNQTQNGDDNSSITSAGLSFAIVCITRVLPIGKLLIILENLVYDTTRLAQLILSNQRSCCPGLFTVTTLITISRNTTCLVGNNV